MTRLIPQQSLLLCRAGRPARIVFVVCGPLMLGYAVGMRNVMHDGRGAVWAPRLTAAIAAGLVISGSPESPLWPFT